MIEYIDRSTNKIKLEDVPKGWTLKWLYNAPLGLLSLHLLIKRKLVTILGGIYMNSIFSRRYIKRFVERYQIDMSQYIIPECGKFRNFNSFFTRKITEGTKEIMDDFVSPSDGKILAFQSLSDIKSFFVKGSEFTIEKFIKDNKLSEKYTDGSMMIIRLSPVDYHRFYFPADAIAEEVRFIKGRYFSVSPIALKQKLKIFFENKRCISLLKTKQYGDVLMSEIGATMVGSIKHIFEPNSSVKKGDEKGYFAFGGSTIILIFEEGKMKIDSDLLENTKRGFETLINFGESIGK